MVDDNPPAGRHGTKLTSWKRIARYLQCGERTARRWRDEEGLPVHSHGAAAQSSVFALTEELDLWLETQAAAGVKSTSTAAVAETASRPDASGGATGDTSIGASGRPPIWLMAVWAFGIGAFALVVFLSIASPAPWTTAAARNANDQNDRVAVLSFENLAPQNAGAGAAQVFSENLRAALTAHNIEIAADGDDAGKAAFTITGALQEDVSGAAINIEIVDRSEGAVLWAGDVLDAEGDFTAAQTEALAHVVGVLSCTLDFAKSDTALRSKALRSLAQFCEANRSQEHRANSMFYAEEVLAAAPDSATANGLMAASLGLSANWTDRLIGDQRSAARDRAVIYAEKAMALDADNRVANAAMIFAHYPPDNWAVIERRFLVALSKDNSEYIVSLMYARFLSKVGRIDEAIHAYRRTLAREPLDVLSVYARIELAALLAQRGDIEGARTHFERALAENPGWTQTHDELVLSELLYGDKPRVQALLNDETRDVSPGARDKACFLAFVAARRDIGIVDSITLPADNALPHDVAENCRDAGSVQIRLFAALGAVGPAFDAIDERLDSAEIMAWSFGPETAAMRHDPRYWAAAEKAGLVSYWRDTGSPPDFCRSQEFAPPPCRELLKEIQGAR